MINYNKCDTKDTLCDDRDDTCATVLKILEMSVIEVYTVISTHLTCHNTTSAKVKKNTCDM